MKWRAIKPGTPGEPHPEDKAGDAFGELAYGDHPRSSISAGDRIYVAPGQVLDNIARAMARIDLDIDTPVSIEEDAVTAEEMMVLVKTLGLGPALAVHVANTALQIMSAPLPRGTGPLAPAAAIRPAQRCPLTLTDAQHQTAKTIFNQRTASTADLTEDDIADQLAPRTEKPRPRSSSPCSTCTAPR
jgi:hypothetical protein